MIWDKHFGVNCHLVVVNHVATFPLSSTHINYHLTSHIRFVHKLPQVHFWNFLTTATSHPSCSTLYKLQFANGLVIWNN